MPVAAFCSSCGQQVDVADPSSKRPVPCPHCGKPVAVPGPASSGPGKPSAPGGGEPLQLSDFGLPPRLQEQAEGELAQGERLVWAGQPSDQAIAVGSIGKAVAFTFGGTFALVVILVIISSGNLPFPLPFVLGGLGGLVPFCLALAVPFAEAARAGRTMYVLTNRRALVWNGRWYGGSYLENYSPYDLTKMRRADSWLLKGAGSVIFREELWVTVTSSRSGSSTRTRRVGYGFLDVDAVREVEKLIRDTLLHPHLHPNEPPVTPHPRVVLEEQAAARATSKAGLYRLAAPVITLGLYAVVVAVALGVMAMQPAKRPPQPAPGGFAPAGGNHPAQPAPGSPEEFAAIRAALTADDEQAKRKAVQRLEKLPPKPEHQAEVAKELAGLLHDPALRDPAAKALRSWATADSVPALIEALDSDSGTVRTEAIDALTRLKPPQAAPALAAKLGSGDRGRASTALQAIGTPAEAAVRGRLTDNDRNTRLEAIKILKKIGTKESLPAIEELTQHKDRSTANAAKDAKQTIIKRGE